MEIDMLLCFLNSLFQHSSSTTVCTIHHNWILPPSGLFRLNIHFAHELLYAHTKSGLHADSVHRHPQTLLMMKIMSRRQLRNRRQKYTLGLKGYVIMWQEARAQDHLQRL